MTFRTDAPSRTISSNMSSGQLLRAKVLGALKAQRDPARENHEVLAAWIIVLSSALLFTILFTILGAVLSKVLADRQTVVLLTLLPIAALMIISCTVLYRRTLQFWSPRKHPTSEDRPLSPGASESSRERSSANGASEESVPNQPPPPLSNDHVIRLTQDFERAIARQQESTLQLIKRHEQLIGDLSTLVRILQERVLIQQAQLEALGAPAPVEDRALEELIRHLPFGKVSMEHMLHLSDQLNERLHLPPFGSDPQ
jgi:hypothetical protein